MSIDPGQPPQPGGQPAPGYQQQPYSQPSYPQQVPQGYPQYGPSGYAQPVQQGYPQQYGYGYAPAVQVAAPAAMYAPPMQPPWARARKRPVALEVTVVVVGGLLASAFVVLMAMVTSSGAVVVAMLLSLVPLLVVGGVLLWVDRWEPEPRFLLIAGFLWGGGVAVAVASLLNSVVGPAVADALATGADPDVAAAVFGAPLVEEGMKGLGILLIFLIRRREFNGPVDGVVYAGVVALGFAVVEDIQYFALNSGDQLGFVFVMRALLSPFGHLIFSLPMGIALGIAARRRARHAWLWMYPIGYVISVSLHMAWNGSLGLASSLDSLVAIFVLLNWLPLAVLALLVVWLRRRESAVVASRLRDYVPSGWLSESEVQSLASMRASLAARRWAKTLGSSAQASMRMYQRSATRLAYARQDLYTGHAGNRARVDEAVLLEEMAHARANVMAQATMRPNGYALG